MTGLKPDSDRIIEVALVVTDGELNTVAEAPVWVVHQSDACWPVWTHGTRARTAARGSSTR
jgi:oligoribonuclease